MKNIMLIAPPAAGKGTQSTLISKAYNIPAISMGMLYREVASVGDSLGKKVDEIMKSGQLVEDKLTLEVLFNRLEKDDCVNGYILEGFPRNLEQAKTYDKILGEKGMNIDYIFTFDAPYELLEDRITGRLSCPKCGHVFNERFIEHKPKIDMICDDCGSDLVKRIDDTKEAYHKRYKVYEDNTKPLIAYYEKKGKVYHIDVTINSEVTFRQIKEILEGDLNEN